MENDKDSSKKIKKNREKRITKPEMLLRKRNVAEWILEGNQPVDIVTSIQKLWHLEQRQAYYYIGGALELLEKNIVGKLGERLSLYISMQLKLYKDVSEDKSLKAKDRYTLRFDIIKEMATMEGIYKHTIKIETEHTEKFEITLDLGGRDVKQIEDKKISLPSSFDNELSESDS